MRSGPIPSYLRPGVQFTNPNMPWPPISGREVFADCSGESYALHASPLNPTTDVAMIKHTTFYSPDANSNTHTHTHTHSKQALLPKTTHPISSACKPPPLPLFHAHPKPHKPTSTSLTQPTRHNPVPPSSAATNAPKLARPRQARRRYTNVPAWTRATHVRRVPSSRESPASSPGACPPTHEREIARPSCHANYLAV